MEKPVKQNTVNIRAFFIRLIPACILFIALFYIIGPFYIKKIMPIIAFEIEFLHPEYTVIDYDIDKIRHLNYLRYTINVNKSEGSRGKGDVIRLKAQASVLCVAPIIMFSLLLSLPGLSIRQRFKTMIISLPLIVVITGLDLPLIFISKIESYYSDNALANSIRSLLNHLLNNGGRQFLAIVAFLIAIAPIYLKRTKIQKIKVARNAPCPCGSGKKYKHCCLS